MRPTVVSIGFINETCALFRFIAKPLLVCRSSIKRGKKRKGDGESVASEKKDKKKKKGSDDGEESDAEPSSRKSKGEGKAKSKGKGSKSGPWSKMRAQMDKLEAQLTSAGKTNKLDKIAPQIAAILKEASPEADQRNKTELLAKIEGCCDERTYKLIEDNISDVQNVQLFVHGKHDVPYVVNALWYSWSGQQTIAYRTVKNNYGGDEGNESDFIEKGGFCFPDELDEYTRKWGHCTLTKEEQEKGMLSEAFESDDPVTDFELPDCLLPLALVFRKEDSFF